MSENKKEHPSYGMIQVSRFTGGHKKGNQRLTEPLSSFYPGYL